jgi:hypothetical protein
MSAVGLRFCHASVCALPIALRSGKVSVRRAMKDWKPGDRSLSSTANDRGVTET